MKNSATFIWACGGLKLSKQSSSQCRAFCGLRKAPFCQTSLLRRLPRIQNTWYPPCADNSYFTWFNCSNKQQQPGWTAFCDVKRFIAGTSEDSTGRKEAISEMATTRNKVENKAKEERRWEDKKEEYKKMDEKTKRSKYKCKKYYTFDDVQTWQMMVKECKDSGKKSSKKAKEDGHDVEKYEVDEDLNSKLSVWKGDITTLEIDAIVNAANSRLLGGGGVDGAIHRAAGKMLAHECGSLGSSETRENVDAATTEMPKTKTDDYYTRNRCPTGDAKITGGYKLPAKYVIHTVGPCVHGKGEPDDAEKKELESCYRKSFELLISDNLRSIAFPCISTGVYGFPHLGAAHIALRTTREFLSENKDKVDQVIFCIFMQKDYDIYMRLLPKYFPVENVVDKGSPDTPKESSPSDEQAAGGDDSQAMEACENADETEVSAEATGDKSDATEDSSSKSTKVPRVSEEDVKRHGQYMKANNRDGSLEN